MWWWVVASCWMCVCVFCRWSVYKHKRVPYSRENARHINCEFNNKKKCSQIKKMEDLLHDRQSFFS